MHKVTKAVVTFALQCATVVAFIVITATMLQCQADRAGADTVPIKAEYVGSVPGVPDSMVYLAQSPVPGWGYCTYVTYPVPMGHTAVSVSCWR